MVARKKVCFLNCSVCIGSLWYKKLFWLARSQRCTDTVRPTCAAWAGHCDTEQVLSITLNDNFLHSGERFCSVKWLTKTLECSISQGIVIIFKTAKIKGINLLPTEFSRNGEIFVKRDDNRKYHSMFYQLKLVLSTHG